MVLQNFKFSGEFSSFTCSNNETILFHPVGGVPDSGIGNGFYRGLKVRATKPDTELPFPDLL